MYKINKLQRSIVEHREILPLFYEDFKFFKNIESLCCIPETNTLL